MSPSLLDFMAWSDYDFARSWKLNSECGGSDEWVFGEFGNAEINRTL